jgi:HK97 family phage major capsid protein
VDDNMPALAAASYSLAYGNFKRAYTIVNRAGTTLIRDNLTDEGSDEVQLPSSLRRRDRRTSKP